MIDSIKHTFEQNIPNIEWMDKKTKEKALEKVGNYDRLYYIVDY